MAVAHRCFPCATLFLSLSLSSLCFVETLNSSLIAAYAKALTKLSDDNRSMSVHSFDLQHAGSWCWFLVAWSWELWQACASPFRRFSMVNSPHCWWIVIRRINPVHRRLYWSGSEEERSCKSWRTQTRLHYLNCIFLARNRDARLASDALR